MTSGPPTLPPQVALMQFLNGLVVSRCLGAAAELGIADQLKDGPRAVSDLATATGSDPGSLYRLLRTLSGLGIFAEQPGGSFQNTPLSEVLRSDVPGSLRNTARWVVHPLHWQTIGDLDFSVRTGKPTGVKNNPGKSPQQIFAEDPGAAAIFNGAMAEIAQAPAVARAYDFTPHKHIVDVGAGMGHVAVLIAQAAPQAKVTVFDLPPVIEQAKGFLAKAGLGDRLEAVGGNFFEKVPGPADVCLLKHILRFSDDDAAKRVLTSCRNALAPGGKILVCEMLITPGPDSLPARIMDIEMLAGPGGRERTEAEYSALFEAAGLRLVRVIPTPSPLRILEAEVRA